MRSIRRGNAYCWGNSDRGKLGYSITGDSRYAQPVSGGLTFRALAAGASHTCGIGNDSNVYCWGDNQYGQVGVGYNNLGFNSSGFGDAQFTSTPRRLIF